MTGQVKSRRLMPIRCDRPSVHDVTRSDTKRQALWRHRSGNPLFHAPFESAEFTLTGSQVSSTGVSITTYVKQ
ncbi:hypothetical protein OG895_18765 [Streptomyces sp. NBC_00201]|uniref:hypothetical protein n=1 Tax=unclassified Streptomyces TaxID=2593676 RepID=UPI00225B1FED|nr:MULTISPECIES: hypothetical protein [unclassified Streptomyces]MCX5055919.1 hypothetical protein [Streptomyces sp. NBC_00452]MCX5247227.1 hypothetical protein [Streptomyces sp. NBC_00201]MCX5287012.1 hypothetical protein [Streptomyces sp. NBC_00183]